MIAALLISCVAMLPTQYPTRLHYAVHQVETSGEVTPPQIGAAGERGPLQITRAAWLDTRRDGERFEDVDTLEYSIVIFDRYMARYATERRLGRKPTDKDKCDIWNGGPRGPWATGRKRERLDAYWAKIKKHIAPREVVSEGDGIHQPQVKMPTAYHGGEQ